MKTLILAGVAAATLMLGGLTTAEASGGCGPFAHRGYYGYCRPNGPFVGGFGYGRPYGFGGPYGWHRGYGWHGGYGWRRHYY